MKRTFNRGDALHTYRVRLWAKRATIVTPREIRAGRLRMLMAELVVKALNRWDAACIAARDMELSESDWNDGTPEPSIVIRVEDMARLPPGERDYGGAYG